MLKYELLPAKFMPLKWEKVGTRYWGNRYIRFQVY